MEARDSVAVSAGLLVGAFVAGVVLAPRLPARMTVHWNAAGTGDGTMGKWAALVALPGLGLVVVAALAGLPRVDPRRESYASFRPRYIEFVVLFAGFLAAAHIVVLAANLGLDVPVTGLVYAGVGAVVYYVGRLLDGLEPNWFVGVRTPWTLSDDAVWAETHRVASRLFRASGVLAVAGAVLGEYGAVLVVGPAVASALAAAAYSYWLYANREDETAGG